MEILRRSASKEILRLLWNQKIHYHVHNSPPRIPVLSQITPIHTLPPHFPNMHFNIILPPTPRSSEWFLPFRLFNQHFFYKFILSSMLTICPANLMLFYLIAIRYLVKSTNYGALIMIFFLPPPVTSSLLGPNIPVSTLFFSQRHSYSIG
jgi:hypothetical protein